MKKTGTSLGNGGYINVKKIKLVVVFLGCLHLRLGLKLVYLLTVSWARLVPKLALSRSGTPFTKCLVPVTRS